MLHVNGEANGKPVSGTLVRHDDGKREKEFQYQKGKRYSEERQPCQYLDG